MRHHHATSWLALLSIVLAFAAQAGAGDLGNEAARASGYVEREIGVRSLPGEEGPVFSAAFKDNIRSRVDKDVITGVVVGVVTPLGTSFYSYGVKSLESREPVDENTVFEIGSITKTFTGLLLARDVVDGRLDLHTPLQEVLPDGVIAPTRNGQSIRLVHLANHTSSLPRQPGNFERTDRENPYAAYDEAQLFDSLMGCELAYDIGTKAVYSNYGMGLLGTVLAHEHGTTYENLVTRMITSPLGMENTRMGMTSDMEANLAKGHRLGMEVLNWDFSALAGAGALRSTAVDMLKYLAANAGIERSELHPAMELAHTPSGGTLGDMSVGLGWVTMTVEGEEIVWHSGGTGGYMSFIGFLKDGERGVVVLTNSNSMPDDLGLHLLNRRSELKTPKPSIAKKLNRVVERDGLESIAEVYGQLKRDHSDEYDFGESELLKLGYRYLELGMTAEALEVFRVNVEAYPSSWNAYDSYGEALLSSGDTEKAIENYRKSVELNPENVSGIAALEKLDPDFRRAVD